MRRYRVELLPGMDGTGRLFDGLRAALPSSLEARAASYSSTEPKTYAVLEVELRSRVGSMREETVVLGESFSGPVAIRLAANPPPNVVAIVLVATFVRSPVTTLLRPFASQFVFELVPPRVAIRHYLLGRDAPLTLVEEVRAAISGVAANVMATRAKEALSVNVQAEFSSIRLPMLFIAARDDRLVKANRERLLRLNAGVEWAEIDGPHLILQREPAKATEILTGFLENLPARPTDRRQ